MVFHGMFQVREMALWDIPGCFTGFKGVSGAFQGLSRNFRSVLRVFKECFRKFQEFFTGFRGSLGHTTWFQVRFRMLQRVSGSCRGIPMGVKGFQERVSALRAWIVIYRAKLITL